MNKLFKRFSLAKRPEPLKKNEEDVEISGPTGFTRTVRGSLNSEGDLLGQEELLKAMEQALANNQPISYDLLMSLKPIRKEGEKDGKKSPAPRKSMDELPQIEEEENPVLRQLQEIKARESKK